MTQANTLTRSIRTALSAGVVGLGALGLAACGGGGGGSDSGSGSLTLGVTDAPVDKAKSVVVEFSSITLKPSDAEDDGGDGDGEGDSGDNPAFVTIEFDEPKSVDLLDQQNGDSKLLIEDESVPAGDYDWIRLGVNIVEGEKDSFIVINGREHELDIPSGAKTGLKLVSGFSVVDGSSLDLTIDFDLRKSVVEAPPGEYKLRPALRLVQDEETGEIAMSATTNYITTEAGANCADTDAQAVYVFEGEDVTPDDIDGKDPEPVTIAALTNDDSDDTWTGTAAFLESGPNTVGFTCNPENDEPPEDGSTPNDDSLTFQDVVNREVKAGETARYDLPLSN